MASFKLQLHNASINTNIHCYAFGYGDFEGTQTGLSGLLAGVRMSCSVSFPLRTLLMSAAQSLREG